MRITRKGGRENGKVSSEATHYQVRQNVTNSAGRATSDNLRHKSREKSRVVHVGWSRVSVVWRSGIDRV